MAKAMSIKKNVGYGNEQKSGKKKRGVNDMAIDAIYKG